MVDRGEMGKGRACRGLVSGEIVRGGWRSGKGVCIAEVPSNRFIEKHLTLLDASSKSFTGRFVGSRELSSRDRDERRRNMMESRGMPDASPIENTSATTLFLPFTLSPSWAYKCVLRVTRRKEGNRRNEIVPCTRNRPVSFGESARSPLSPASIEYSKLSSRKKLLYPPWRVCAGRQEGLAPFPSRFVVCRGSSARRFSRWGFSDFSRHPQSLAK